MIRSLALGAFIALPFAAAVSAQERSEAECSQLHPEIPTPVEMVWCTSDIEGSEATVDEAERQLHLRLPDEYRATFDAAQGAWRAYRDLECAFEAAGFSGTGQSSAVIACEAGMNRARAEELTRELGRWVD
jgi:uncharacterized protein YecT (DUF1311 family)